MLIVQGTTRDSDLLAGCKILANSEYLARHNSAYGDSCFLGKRTRSIKSECEIVSRKVE